MNAKLKSFFMVSIVGLLVVGLSSCNVSPQQEKAVSLHIKVSESAWQTSSRSTTQATPSPRTLEGISDQVWIYGIGNDTATFSEVFDLNGATTFQELVYVPLHTQYIYALALKSQQIIALGGNPELLTLNTEQVTELSIALTPISLDSGATQQYYGANNPLGNKISQTITGIPAEFLPFFNLATAYLYTKKSLAPATILDFDTQLSAESTLVGSTLSATTTIPETSVEANDTLYYWIGYEWPMGYGNFVRSDLSLPDALVYNGASVAGKLEEDFDSPPDGWALVSSAAISISALSLQTTTDTNGEYFFEAVQPGSHVFNINISGSNSALPLKNVSSGYESSVNAGNTWQPGAQQSASDFNSTNINVGLGDHIQLDFRYLGY